MRVKTTDAKRQKTVDASNTLSKVLDLFADPEHWCKGTLARSADGQPTLPRATDAVRFCLLGAIQHVTGQDYNSHTGLRAGNEMKFTQ